ncbi:MAG: gas vesicle protein K [Planctomycetota bacterium]|nr:gas vesicle protein K [Planctomycetota bacterium]
MININEDNLKNGVLGLVLAVVEILRDALQHQAIRRIETGGLSDEEVERLGLALADLDGAIEGIKREQGLGQAVQSVRDGLDDLVNDVVGKLTGAEQWSLETAGAKR